MNCPNCNTPLENTYTCPGCGRKDELAKKIIYASNWHYNQGLAKTKVRDLTGATGSLLMSLKYNKRNTQARNLLGLVYYQMGEIVNALGEWVISVNFQPKDNVANTYIKAIQNNPGKLAFANRTIQKYNTALSYLHGGDMDMAIIELKKVININPNYIKAYQLMGLLYFKTKQYAAARKVLIRSLKIDRNNITSLRYIKEIELAAGEGALTKNRRRDGFTQINDPNPVVIEENKDQKYTDFNTSLLSIVNVIIGVIIGAAVIWLLVVPSLKKSSASEYNQTVVEYSSQITEKNKMISALNKEKADLQTANDMLQSQIDSLGASQASGTSVDMLYKAVRAYIAGNMNEAGLYLADVDPAALTNEDASELYITVFENTKANAVTALAANGYENFLSEDYMAAMEDYQKVLNLDSENLDAIYYMGACYQRLADIDNAMIYYNRLINDYSGTTQAANAAEAVRQIKDATGQTGRQDADGQTETEDADGQSETEGADGQTETENADGQTENPDNEP